MPGWRGWILVCTRRNLRPCHATCEHGIRGGSTRSVVPQPAKLESNHLNHPFFDALNFGAKHSFTIPTSCPSFGTCVNS